MFYSAKMAESTGKPARKSLFPSPFKTLQCSSGGKGIKAATSFINNLCVNIKIDCTLNIMF